MSDPSDDLRPQKSRLRAQLRGRRRELSAQDRARAARRWADGLSGLVAEHPDGPVLAYLPLPEEPPLAEALRELVAQREVLLPVTRPGRRMLWAPWRPETVFVPSGPGGLREPEGSALPAPERPGLVLVPALAVGEDGVRLGMGGGFYDTFLADLAPGTPAVGCVFSWEVLPAGSVPADPWDARLRRALTELGPRELGGPEAS